MAEKDEEKSDDLYTDANPETTVEGLGFKDKETAEESVDKLKHLLKEEVITRDHAKQICVTMEQRSKHHPHRNEDMKKAEKIYREYLEKLKNND
ncbi:hypothetical protein GCM10009117_08420 [Gangjinia marincola]|uniref:Uncharacterized protein n=1 Tax=Gangjinia marincola TaxID=578463 RepID=A0ABP3XR05_9FLAO